MQTLGRKAQTPKGLSGRLQSMPKQQDIDEQSLGSAAEQHWQSRQSWKGAPPTPIPTSMGWYSIGLTGKNSAVEVVVVLAREK